MLACRGGLTAPTTHQITAARPNLAAVMNRPPSSDIPGCVALPLAPVSATELRGNWLRVRISDLRLPHETILSIIELTCQAGCRGPAFAPRTVEDSLRARGHLLHQLIHLKAFPENVLCDKFGSPTQRHSVMFRPRSDACWTSYEDHRMETAQGTNYEICLLLLNDVIK